MKPSEKIEKIIERYQEEARKRNKEAKKRRLGGFNENREVYLIPAIIEILDEMAEKIERASWGIPDIFESLNFKKSSQQLKLEEEKKLNEDRGNSN